MNMVRNEFFFCVQNPDRLFDPEDPAVKELEEWELRSPHHRGNYCTKTTFIITA
jgi:hypothetical protein